MISKEMKMINPLLEMFKICKGNISLRLPSVNEFELLNALSKVYVGETLCGAVEWAAGKTVFQVNCDGASGSKVRITQDGQFLTLCEVQVLGEFGC